MGAMAKTRRPEPHPYSSFDAIHGDPVHLRGRDDDETVEPRYSDAELRSLTGSEGARVGSFYVPSMREVVTGISEVNYVAWNRY